MNTVSFGLFAIALLAIIFSILIVMFYMVLGLAYEVITRLGLFRKSVKLTRYKAFVEKFRPDLEIDTVIFYGILIIFSTGCSGFLIFLVF